MIKPREYVASATIDCICVANESEQEKIIPRSFIELTLGRWLLSE